MVRISITVTEQSKIDLLRSWDFDEYQEAEGIRFVGTLTREDLSRLEAAWVDLGNA